MTDPHREHRAGGPPWRGLPAERDSDGGLDRRTLMRLIGANLAAMGLAGCGGDPPEDIVPYVDRPESVLPGRPSFYATALPLAGFGYGVLGESHTGRPTRIQGNPDDPVSRGASTAIHQATVFGLYDPARAFAIRRRGEAASWESFLGAAAGLRAALARDDGAGLRLLTGTVTSPSVLAAIDGLRRRFPGLRRHGWEPVDRSAARDGATIAFGEGVDTRYDLAAARRILSLDADFLGVEDPAHLAQARGFAAARRPGPETPPARLYAVESTPTLTGAKADHRLALPASAIAALARTIAARLGVDVAAPPPSAGTADWIEAMAADLLDHPGAAVVVPGLTQPAEVHALAHAMNAALGAVGPIVSHHDPVGVPPDGSLRDLLVDIAGGVVTCLVIFGGNPVYDAPADLDLIAALQAVPTTVHLAPEDNETAAFSAWVIPEAHPLEAWGDLRGADGTTYLCQPLIRPLHGGRTAVEVLRAIAGDATPGAREALRQVWADAGLADDTAWAEALRRGTVEGTAAAARAPTLRPGLGRALGPAPDPAPGGLELQFRPHPMIWDGRYAANGWLQELPHPLTKQVWGNAALVAPALAEERGLATGDVVRLERDGRVVEAPVWIMPGQPRDAVTLALGFGRPRAGPLGSGVGASAYRLRTTGALWSAPGVTMTPTGARADLASTQHHHAIEGRDLLRRGTWEEWRDHPAFARHGEEEPASLYPEPGPGSGTDQPYAWGMVIDYDACIGCGACVAACQAENNIPIVGKEEVARGRDMHWLRIDRYYAGPADDPETLLQPVPCMHCENAPCEYVCPVEATQHSPEGLNEMVYNRCIGTRYCSQNCPYKVRRFNWLDYAGRDAALPTPAPAQNPDVSVRPRGVMEKCTYCVQRINRARIAADREGRTIADGEVVTACQEACPTRAIVFGDIADAGSAVSAAKRDGRNYGMLAELGTRPRTTYLAEVRDPNPALRRRGPTEEGA